MCMILFESKHISAGIAVAIVRASSAPRTWGETTAANHMDGLSRARLLETHYNYTPGRLRTG